MNNATKTANTVADVMVGWMETGTSIRTAWEMAAYGLNADAKLLLSAALAERGCRIAAECALAWSGAEEAA